MSFWVRDISHLDWSVFRYHERMRLFTQIAEELGETLEQPPFAAVWEDPETDGPVQISVPAPEWWAMALHGGIHPPAWVTWALNEDEAQPGFVRHHRGHLLHETPPLGPLSPRAAMELFVQLMVPFRVWRDYRGNRQILRIVPRDLLPEKNELRDAWRLNQEEAA